jgi:hypothetical protein
MGQVKAGQMVLEGRCAVLEQSTLSTLGELGEADWKTSDYTPDYGNDTLMKLVEAEPRDIYTLSAELGNCEYCMLCRRLNRRHTSRAKNWYERVGLIEFCMGWPGGQTALQRELESHARVMTIVLV